MPHSKNYPLKLSPELEEKFSNAISDPRWDEIDSETRQQVNDQFRIYFLALQHGLEVLSKYNYVRPNVSPQSDSEEKKQLRSKKKEMEYFDYMNARLNAIEFNPDDKGQLIRLFHVMALVSLRRGGGLEPLPYGTPEYLEQLFQLRYGPPPVDSIEHEIFGFPSDEKMLDYIEGTYDPRCEDPTYNYVAFASENKVDLVGVECRCEVGNWTYELVLYQTTDERFGSDGLFRKELELFIKNQGRTPNQEFEHFSIGQAIEIESFIVESLQDYPSLYLDQYQLVYKTCLQKNRLFLEKIKKNRNRISYELLTEYIL